jgi:hypothetical protein
MQPSANGFINSMILSLLDGALYQVYAAIRRSTLRSSPANSWSAPVRRGRRHGALDHRRHRERHRRARQVHILVKPTRPS